MKHTGIIERKNTHYRSSVTHREEANTWFIVNENDTGFQDMYWGPRCLLMRKSLWRD